MLLLQEAGKTAVLVERIIEKIIKGEIDIDKLLVVTFTNAAASEMRERVLKAIDKKLEEDPENVDLQRQVTLLNVASICTIDSFCLEVVKNHFYELDNLAPNFRIADTPEIELLKQEVLEDLFEEKYKKYDQAFSKLIHTYTSYRDDTPLKELILKIYQYISSSPFPQKWLHEKVEMFNLKSVLEQDFSNTPWGRILLDDINDELIDDITILQDVQDSLYGTEELEPFAQAIASDIGQLENLKQNLNSWDKSYEIAQNIKFITWPRKKLESEEKDNAKKVRDIVKKKLSKKLDSVFTSNSKQANEDLYEMYPTLQKLEQLILEFDINFSKQKRNKNIVDFTDIEHFALNILLKENENGILEPSEIAKEYRNKFQEIAIDEYQDSNMVQESILTAISRENNIFMVGDVKQSIYKFRQAMPELFLSKYREYPKVQEKQGEKQKDNVENIQENGQEKSLESFQNVCYGSKEKNYEKEKNAERFNGKKIQLYKNFRSRANVLDFTNLVFENIMSENLGDVNYNKEEYLNLGASDYPEINQSLKTEIHIIDKKEKENISEGVGQKEYEEQREQEEQGEQEENKAYNVAVASKKLESDKIKNAIETEEAEETEENGEQIEPVEDINLEAQYVASQIQKLMEEKFQVYDRKNEKFRDITYRDIVILLRSTKDKANIFEQELIRAGIPVFSDSTQEYLDTIEIETIMSVLKIIDNPIQDIPLVTVLRSQIGGFTDDELVEIRLSDQYDNFYECILKAKVNVSTKLKEKIQNFLVQLQEWREEQEYLALDELIWKIYSDTGYYNFVGLMPNGAIRQANLKMLFERAKQYESASIKGLYNFINFMEKIRLSSGDMSAAKIIGENDNVVRIMSIHKSKGLEFPVVFLANINKQFNLQDIRNDAVLLHQNLGIGAKYIDYDAQIQYDTLSRQAVKLQMVNENLSEEMRVLYVALTRAKEKIFITGIERDFAKKTQKLQEQVEIYEKENGKINPILVKKGMSYLDWILMVYFYESQKAEQLLDLKVIKKNEWQKKWKNEQEEKNNKLQLLGEVIEKGNELGYIVNDEEENKEQVRQLEQIEQVLEYTYPYKFATQIPTKTSVTKLKELAQKKIASYQWEDEEIAEGIAEGIGEGIGEEVDETLEEEYGEKKSKVMLKDTSKEETLTSAQKGTIMHLCLQKLDIKKDYQLLDIKEFVKELQNKEILTEKEAESVNYNKLLTYTKSRIWNELMQAKEICREKPFYIPISAKSLFEDVSFQNLDDETILVQGIVDLYYKNRDDELVLVDYKTDYVPDGKETELVIKYKKQLELYKRALEDAFDTKVARVYIYSLYLGKEILVNIEN